MRVIQAPNVYRSLPLMKPEVIFLAGSIEMGSAEKWQDEIIDVIKISDLNTDNAVILNPRRDDWDNSWKQTITNSNFREQVEWELCGLEDANMVIFYFDPTTQSPITLMELGTMTNKENTGILVCCPDGYWRKGNVEVFCEFNSIVLYHTKEELIKDLKNMVWK